MFQKFGRIPNPLSDIVGGNGLGLYLARIIVDMHVGSLEIASKLVQGSTHTIRLTKK